MSEKNVELVRRIYAALTQGDGETIRTWRNFPQFKNQEECIAFVNHGP